MTEGMWVLIAVLFGFGLGRGGQIASQVVKYFRSEKKVVDSKESERLVKEHGYEKAMEIIEVMKVANEPDTITLSTTALIGLTENQKLALPDPKAPTGATVWDTVKAVLFPPTELKHRLPTKLAREVVRLQGKRFVTDEQPEIIPGEGHDEEGLEGDRAVFPFSPKSTLGDLENWANEVLPIANEEEREDIVGTLILGSILSNTATDLRIALQSSSTDISASIVRDLLSPLLSAPNGVPVALGQIKDFEPEMFASTFEGEGSHQELLDRALGDVASTGVQVGRGASLAFRVLGDLVASGCLEVSEESSGEDLFVWQENIGPFNEELRMEMATIEPGTAEEDE